MSKNIKGIVIDAGHGGNDPGTIHNDIVEKEYALKISNYMSQRFNELGVPNKLSRSTDITLNPNDRTNLIKSLYGNGNDILVVSNHINAGGGDGAEIIYSLRNTDELSKLISDEFIKSGQNVRKYYQRRLPSNPSKDYYFILRDTANNESILVEYGFADSTKDDVNQIKNNWKDLTEAVIKAICSYIGVSYVAPQLVVDDTYYIVKKGDTLWSIARMYNISVNDLKKLNGLSTNLINIGQKLLVKQTSDDNNVYTVVKGDTLYSIAKKYKISVDDLKSINNLSTDFLSIGQKLVIPKADNYNTYTVVKGDTLYAISRKFNTTVSELVNINNLSTSVLQIGQKLLVPKV